MSRPLDADASLRVCDFFEIAKNRCGKQNRYGDKTVENSKKSQTCRMTRWWRHFFGGSDVYWHASNMPELTHDTASRPELSRDLGVSHASAVVVGTIIGSGIFLVPAEMMQAVGSAKLVYLAWVVGGLLSFFGALTYAELGAMKPQAGGEYVYVRDGYGPLAGFLYAWTWFVIAKPASVATVVTGLVRILGTFSVFSFFSTNVISAPFAVNWGQLFAIAAAILISLLNYLGVKKAGEFQLVFTLLKVAIILGIVVVCFSGMGNVAGRGWSNFAGTFSGRKGWDRRIHGGAGGGALGLRRME